MKQKKSICVLLSVCFLMVIAGCANLIAVSAAGASQPTTIVFTETLTSPERTEYVKSLIQRFESENPDIRVVLDSLPWEQARDKLITQIVTRQTPDVVEMADNWLAEMGHMGALVDLTPYFNKWEHKDEFIPSALVLGKKIGDMQHSLGYGMFLRAMFYRSDWLEEAGLPVPKTYDELLQTSIKITDPAKNRFGYSFRGGMGIWTQLVNFLLTQSGHSDYFDENGISNIRDPKAVQAFIDFCELYYQAAPRDSLNWGYNEKVNAFTTGQTGFLMQDSEVIPSCEKTMTDGTWATAPLPVGPDGKRYMVSGIIGFSMFENSQNKEEAWRFISFLLDPEINAEWNIQTQTMPVMSTAFENEFFGTGHIKAWSETASDPNTVFFAHPPFPEWGEFFGRVSVNTIQAYLLKEITAEDCIDELATFLEEAYKNSN